jgi:hypothetical protein
MTTDTAKKVPTSKETEWKGLDRISAVVHGMRCIWREQEKDDIGIDGEIELCVERSDGEGRVGTGKIVKVQSKSGSSYITKNTTGSFELQTRRSDLEYWQSLNVPVIAIVYHPDDDRLYWVDVKAQIAARDDVFTPPYRLRFDKIADVFDNTAYPRLLAIVNAAPERVAMDVEETLFTNALEILEMPTTVVRSTVLPEKRAQFRQRLTGFVPPHVYSAGVTVTLTDPTDTENALKDVVEGPGEVLDLSDWLDDAGANENNFRYILKRLLHRHLIHGVGLAFDPELKRYYYPINSDKDDIRKVTWRSLRTKKSATRAVAKKFTYGTLSFFRHLALEPEFIRIGDSWALIVEPKHHYTTDGKTRWDSKKARSFAIRNRAREYNAQYLNHILFWSHVISGGKTSFALELDRKQIVRISGTPLSAQVGFGVRATPGR